MQVKSSVEGVIGFLIFQRRFIRGNHVNQNVQLGAGVDDRSAEINHDSTGIFRVGRPGTAAGVARCSTGAVFDGTFDAKGFTLRQVNRFQETMPFTAFCSFQDIGDDQIGGFTVTRTDRKLIRVVTVKFCGRCLVETVRIRTLNVFFDTEFRTVSSESFADHSRFVRQFFVRIAVVIQVAVQSLIFTPFAVVELTAHIGIDRHMVHQDAVDFNIFVPVSFDGNRR